MESRSCVNYPSSIWVQEQLYSWLSRSRWRLTKRGNTLSKWNNRVTQKFSEVIRLEYNSALEISSREMLKILFKSFELSGFVGRADVLHTIVQWLLLKAAECFFLQNYGSGRVPSFWSAYCFSCRADWRRIRPRIHCTIARWDWLIKVYWILRRWQQLAVSFMVSSLKLWVDFTMGPHKNGVLRRFQCEKHLRLEELNFF